MPGCCSALISSLYKIQYILKVRVSFKEIKGLLSWKNRLEECVSLLPGVYFHVFLEMDHMVKQYVLPILVMLLKNEPIVCSEV